MLTHISLQSLIVKPVSHSCNLRCDYCFYLEKKTLYPKPAVMSLGVLEELIRQLMEQTPSKFGITWQGGEPSLAGEAFYAKAIQLMFDNGKERNKIISNAFQTNGFRLNDSLISLFQQYSFLLGLSLDGPEEIHNSCRHTLSGNGSFVEAMKSWKKLQKAGIATNILCCIHSASMGKAAEIYFFFKEHGMNWLQFIPVLERDALGNILSFSINSEKYGNFLCQIFDYWFHDLIKNGTAPIIRFIENAFHSHLGIEAPECSYQAQCGNYLVVEHNGDVYSCDFFVNPKQLLGNIMVSRLTDLLNSRSQTEFGEVKSNCPYECLQCKWLSFCHSGCPKYRDDKGKFMLCDGWKQFLDYSNHRLAELARKWLADSRNQTYRNFDAGKLI